jgi:DNA polymerase IV
MMLDYTQLVEVFSIDEAFLDVTHFLKIYGMPEHVVYLLKNIIKQSFGLICGHCAQRAPCQLASEIIEQDRIQLRRCS